MAIVINGSGAISGISTGGLPDGIVDDGTLATSAVTSTKILDGTILNADVNDVAASKLTGALPVIDGSNLTGLSSGLSEADQWRLHTGFSGGGPLIANLERNDTGLFTKLGTGMTQSSGAFAFPSTGYWFISFCCSFEMPVDNYTSSRIQYVTDNSSNWASLAQSTSSSTTGGYYHNSTIILIVDITDTSNQKIRFYGPVCNEVNGNTSHDATSMVFIKLGET